MRLVTVVDAPGWEGGVAGPTPERVKREMVGSVALCPPGPHAVLLTLRVDTLVKVDPVREHLELLGEGVWRHTVLLFTHGDQLREGVGIEQHIQSGGRDLQWLMEKCRGRYHIISNGDGGGGGGGGRGNGAPTQVMELLEKVEKMAAGNRCEAFSGTVQEVSDLSRQKNERFNQRLKEIGNKMLRQEAELKKMREREVKSISSRFFDRRKKPKSPGKADVEREEEEDEEERRSSERKNDMGELEERIRWLTEDKEREIQDLSAENDRIVAALHLKSREREEGIVQLESKEREVEELKERIDELQLKLLDLERVGAERDRETKQWEDEIRGRQQEWRRDVGNLKERIECQEREKAELMKTVDALQTDMCETKRHYEDILSQREDERKVQESYKKRADTSRQLKEEMERRLCEKEKEMEEMRVQCEKEMKRAFKEKETALDGMRHLEKEMERKLEEKVEEIKSRHKKEMNGTFLKKEKEVEDIKLRYEEEMARKSNEIEKLVEEKRVQYQEEMARTLREKEADMEKVKLHHQVEIRNIQQETQREIEELRQQHVNQMEVKLKENEEEKEMINANHKKVVEQRNQEKGREIEGLKQQHATELEKKRQEKVQKERMNVDYKNEMEQRLEEKERETGELKQRSNQMEEKLREQEKEKERIFLHHKREVEEKVEEKEREIEVLKQQHAHEMEKNLQEKEREREGINLKHRTEIEQKLEEKVREIEVLKHRANQMEEKLREKENTERINLKRKGEMEQRLKEKEKEIEEMKLQHANEMEEKLRENEEKEMIHAIYMQKLLEKDREMEKIQRHLKEMGAKLQEKETELEGMKLQTDTRETEWRDEQRTMDERKDKEINKLMEIIEKKAQEITQTQQLVAQREKEIEDARDRCANHSKESEQLKENDKKKTSDIIEIKQWCTEQARKKDAETTEMLQEKEKELDSFKQRDRDNEKEIAQLRQTIEQTKSELKDLTAKIQKEMTNMIQEYEREIGRRNENMESIAKEKEIALRQLEQVEEESKQRISDVTEKFEESQRRVDVLREANEKMRKEMDNLRQRCEECEKEEYAARRVNIERREAEVRELTCRVKTGEFDLQNVLNERDREIAALKEANETLQGEMERMKEREKDDGKQLNEMREHQQGQLMAKQNDSDVRGDGIEEELLKREREIEAREQDLMRVRKELRNRGHELEMKEKEVVKREGKLETKERDLKKWDANLEIKQRERKEIEQGVRHKRDELLGRELNIERKEKELETCLQVLEIKQEELNSHGQDIQMKIKELRDWGKGLEERENHLRNEEKELFSWRTELERQNEHMKSKQQEISEIGGELTSIQQELQSRKKHLKDTVEKLRKWEESLERRETELYEREHGHGSKEKEAAFRHSDGGQYNGECEVDVGECNRQTSNNGVHGKSLCNLTAVFDDGPGAADGAHVMYQEVGVVEERERAEEERGKGSYSGRSSKEREDQRIEMALSAIGNNNCQFETLGEIEIRREDVQKEEMKERVAEERKGMKRERKVIRDFQLLSSSQGHRVADIKDVPGSELKLLVLGETWSSRYPTRVTVLGGEAAQPGASTSMPWRGQIAGRHVSVVEPMGLRWRNGADPTDIAQEKSIRDSVSLFHPGPHVLLLVIPAHLTFTQKYRKALENHMGLLGEEIWRRTLVLFTWGEALGESAEQHVLRNGDLMWLIEKCGGRYHVLTSKKNSTLTERLFEKIEEMVALNDREGSFV